MKSTMGRVIVWSGRAKGMEEKNKIMEWKLEKENTTALGEAKREGDGEGSRDRDGKIMRKVAKEIVV
ncbi:hypothetical protein GH714_032650 [Hevea brasiliensis]|uniref:Uncharacterized protein n=1 Tax=Hevea brasiliensis TaxID=3981 RepID=A0A6A6KBR0_HEVBR|nr:hypothetical protein GH714_032650 [Hevea brasiliensis]